MLKISLKTIKETLSHKTLCSDIEISIKKGETHLLVGPNGAGKSSVAKAIMGDPNLKVTGSIQLDKTELRKLPMHKRSLAGLFLAHQTPVEIPGVTFFEFLREIFNQNKTIDNRADPITFKNMMSEHLTELRLEKSFLEKDINHNLSGGEKKKSEILQMLVLEPRYVIFDEIDSGLDVDALKLLFQVINSKIKTGDIGALLISHNTKIHKYIDIDRVHIMDGGQIIKTGDINLISKLGKEGYESIKKSS